MLVLPSLISFVQGGLRTKWQAPSHSTFLNHWLFTLILKKAGLDFKVISFFTNYLVKRKTSYIWNGLPSPTFKVNVRVGQGSALSPVLLALYLFSFLYILENHLKILKIPVSILSFVDDGLIIAQNKSIDISNSYLFCVKIVDSRLCFYFLFSLYFIFLFLFLFFSIFRTTQVRGYQSRCHISHKLMA